MMNMHTVTPFLTVLLCNTSKRHDMCKLLNERNTSNRAEHLANINKEHTEFRKENGNIDEIFTVRIMIQRKKK